MQEHRVVVGGAGLPFGIVGSQLAGYADELERLLLARNAVEGTRVFERRLPLTMRVTLVGESQGQASVGFGRIGVASLSAQFAHRIEVRRLLCLPRAVVTGTARHEQQPGQERCDPLLS